MNENQCHSLLVTQLTDGALSCCGTGSINSGKRLSWHSKTQPNGKQPKENRAA